MEKKKILIVEDETAYLEMLSVRLEEEKYDVILAENGKDAILKAISEKPDLILLDMLLPDMNGLEVMKIVSSSCDLNHIPIIVISAVGREADIQKAYEAGAKDYLVKPYSFDNLLNKIRKILK